VRRILPFLVAAALLGGCGGGDGSNDVLAKTAANLGDVRSGTLAFDLLVTPRGGAGGPPFGFKLAGPFATRASGLPVTRMDYTQVANGKQQLVTLISTGSKGFMTIDGKTYELPEARLAPLRAVTAAFGGQGAASLPLDDWIRDADVSDGGEIGGAETDRVHGDLDVARAAADLGSLAFGGRDLTKKEREQLADATRSATIDVWSGKDDRLLRKLAIAVDLGFDVPADLRAALGQLVGAKIALTMAVSDPNRPVSVKAPTGALPYPG
jgi:hypothetical protein